jgi:hypothetical protein
MPDIIVSLTSYPPRIPCVYPVVKSLLAQTEAADEIILWLSREEFPEREAALPEELRSLVGTGGFRIAWVEGNLKSHKKYYYALQDQKNVVITVDDDAVYASSMIHTLMESYRKHPCAVSARRVRMIFREEEHLMPYLDWERMIPEYIGEERMDLCAIGANGILYPPGTARESWFDAESIRWTAEDQDDLWLKFHQIQDRIPVVYTGLGEEDERIEGSQERALCVQNGGGGANDAAVSRLLGRLRAESGSAYRNWFDGLLTLEEYTAEKRTFQQNRIKHILDSNPGRIYIAGAGMYAGLLFSLMEDAGCADRISAFVVSEKTPGNDQMRGIPVKAVGELENGEAAVILCGVSERYREEVRQSFDKLPFCRWTETDMAQIKRLRELEERVEN